MDTILHETGFSATSRTLQAHITDAETKRYIPERLQQLRQYMLVAGVPVETPLVDFFLASEYEDHRQAVMQCWGIHGRL